MPNTAINAPPGYYTSLAITDVVETHFPDAYNALLDPSELAWEAVSIPGYYKFVLFLGYINLAGSIHKVLAGMAVSDDDVKFFTRSGLALSRADNGRMQLVAPWVYLAENIERPQLINVVTLCQFFFVAAGVSTGVWVNSKRWFCWLEMSCLLVGEGMGVLVRAENGLGGVDGGYEGGRK